MRHRIRGGGRAEGEETADGDSTTLHFGMLEDQGLLLSGLHSKREHRHVLEKQGHREGYYYLQGEIRDCLTKPGLPERPLQALLHLTKLQCQYMGCCTLGKLPAPPSPAVRQVGSSLVAASGVSKSSAAPPGEEETLHSSASSEQRQGLLCKHTSRSPDWFPKKDQAGSEAGRQLCQHTWKGAMPLQSQAHPALPTHLCPACYSSHRSQNSSTTQPAPKVWGPKRHNQNYHFLVGPLCWHPRS